MNTVDEIKYIQKLRKGDSTAFHILYNMWSGKLYNFVMSLSGNNTYLAEEMVQSVFLSIWEKRKELDPSKSFNAFLCTIAKNRLINHYRSQLVEIQYVNKYKKETEEGEPTTEQDVDYRILEKLIKELVEQLPIARRKIYQLSKFHHLSNKQIAEQLNLSENTIESQLTKANSFIRNQLLKRYEIGRAHV